jgi:hypothetical protein
MLKRGQLGFGNDSRLNTFGAGQNSLYSTTKSNKINEAIVLKQKGETTLYFKGIFINKNYLISDILTLSPNGKFIVGKNN